MLLNIMPMSNLGTQKRAQSALEFLTTYAWAFLVILVMIGTIAYFGILRPQRILPDRCNFGAEFSCLDYQISATNNQLKIKLKNNLASPVTISAISLSSETTTKYTCTLPPAEGYPTNWQSGNITDLTFTGCNTAAAGFVQSDKGKVLIKITYYDIKSGSSYSRDVQGEVFATVS